MALSRVSDAQTFSFLVERAGRLQVSLRTLQEQIASGKRLLGPEQDPFGAAQVVRLEGDLAALGQHAEASRFGRDVLGAEDDALGEAEQVLVRAEEIATQQASDLLGPEERAAAREEVHGLLEALTALGNSELAGRRLFGGLALDAPPPFADPDTPGYAPSTAYGGSTQEFSVKVGGGSSERVRVSTRGDAVFQGALEALGTLDSALATGVGVAGTLTGLAQGRATLAAERASVGVRQAQLVDRTHQVGGLVIQDQGALSRVQDADLVAVISQLTQAETALRATLAAGARLAETSLVNLLRL